MDLHNKNILITGASRGLGKELAKRLSKSEPNLVLIARSIEELELLQNEIEEQTGKTPCIVKCDVSNESEVSRMVALLNQRFRYIDVVVNNAGIGIHKESETLQNDEMRKMFEVNFFGIFYLINSLLPLLKKSDAGYFLNVGSLVSQVAFPGNSIYAATKSALTRYTQGLSQELRKYNIRVGIIHPGFIDTSFHQNSSVKSEKPPSFFVSHPASVAVTCEKMILKQRRVKYMSKCTLGLMKLKQLINQYGVE
jgi:short-subunit dehydrogenase